MSADNRDCGYSHNGWLAVLVALLVAVSCAASTPAKCSSTSTWTVTLPLAGKLDAETVAGIAASPRQQGQMYYVATGGDDSNPGTEARPFRTIERAANVAQNPGDTVFIRSGSYAPFRIRYSGAEGRPITFRNYPGERPVVDGRLGSGHGIVLQEHTDYRNSIGWIVIEGIEVTHAAIDGIKGYRIHHIVIRNCEIHHSQMNNLLVSGSHHVTIDSNRFYESDRQDNELPPTSPTGHDIYASGNYWTVTNNLFYGGDWYMVQMTAYTYSDAPEFGNVAHWVIANNTFAFCRHRSGITMNSYGGGYVNDTKIFNNIFYRNAESEYGQSQGGANGIAVSTQHTDIENVLIYNNVHHGLAPFITGERYQEFDNIGDDPQFLNVDQSNLDNNDFHLRPSSPAIDMGTSQGAPSRDFDGNSRPRGAGYDIGAYESPFSTQVTDLRVVAAAGGTPNPTLTLRWTAPAAAVTYTLRSSDSLLTATNWGYASIVTMPFPASEPGSVEWLTTPVDYAGVALYLALKSQNSAGLWSELSNNAFWPNMDIRLPLIMKKGMQP